MKALPPTALENTTLPVAGWSVLAWRAFWAATVSVPASTLVGPV